MRNVEPLLAQKTAEMEANKVTPCTPALPTELGGWQVLLVKARQVIQKLQGSTDVANDAERDKTRAAEARCSCLQRCAVADRAESC